jgi:hypothetical protein
VPFVLAGIHLFSLPARRAYHSGSHYQLTPYRHSLFIA